MNIFYRISDKGSNKTKVCGVDKKICLESFLKHFGQSNITFVADNCDSSTIDWLNSIADITPITGLQKVIQTNLGNSGASKHTMSLACKLPENSRVYIAEDDYLYTGDHLIELLNEGLGHSHYATLYDHPDKYESEYRAGEMCRVFKTKHSHWRTTISTTMTFATTVRYLKEDKNIWDHHSQLRIPLDHMAFVDIAKTNKHVLSVCIPGRACHMDTSYSARKGKMLIDEWAVEDVCQYLENQIIDKQKYLAVLEEPPSMRKLAMLSQLVNSDQLTRSE